MNQNARWNSEKYEICCQAVPVNELPRYHTFHQIFVSSRLGWNLDSFKIILKLFTMEYGQRTSSTHFCRKLFYHLRENRLCLDHLNIYVLLKCPSINALDLGIINQIWNHLPCKRNDRSGMRWLKAGIWKLKGIRRGWSIYRWIGPERDAKHTNDNFRFSPCIIIVNHFYCPTNALNYTKLRA